MNKLTTIALLSASWGVGGIIPANAQVNKTPNAITVKINNIATHFDSAPVIKSGILLAPLRGFLEAIGADVNYQSDTGNVRINIYGTTVEMKNGTRYVYVDGQEKVLPRPLPIINGRIMIPLRSVAEKMGSTVVWNKAQRTVYINNLKTEVSQPAPQQGMRAGEINVHATANKSTFRTGEIVHLKVTATNTDDRPRKLTLPSGQTFDVTITPTGKEAPKWKWSHGKMFTMAIRYVELKPGEQLTFSTEWNQTDNEGQVMPRGKVDVNAILTSLNAGIKANRLMLHLVE